MGVISAFGYWVWLLGRALKDVISGKVCLQLSTVLSVIYVVILFM